MTTFLQLHLLTSYPPACLNRDDMNRPKSVVMGGVNRLRISSQCLKRTWRVSEIFREHVNGHTGIRSKELGRLVNRSILGGKSLGDLLKSPYADAKSDGTVSDKNAKEWAWMIVSEYVDKSSKGGHEEEADESQDADAAADMGDSKKKKREKANVDKDTLKSEQIVFYSKPEIAALDNLIKAIRESNKAPTKKQLDKILVESPGGTADLALFGRMLASRPECNVEAACQVAHAITVHRAMVDDDYFSAVDDLNRREDTGFAFGSEQGFGAGLFYEYICIDCDLLKENLKTDADDNGAELASKTIMALIEAATTVAPTGKQNSFASRAWAYYCLAEKGPRQPRSLSLAFMRPVTEHGEGMLVNAVSALKGMRDSLDQVYFKGQALDSSEFYAALNVKETHGSLKQILDFASSCEKTDQ